MMIQESILNKVVVVYARVSTREQAVDGYSIIRQVNMGEEYASKLGYSQVRVITDEGYSAKNFERPGIRELIKLVKTDLVSAIIIKDLDRLSRNQLLTLQFFDLLETHKVKLIGTNFNASRETAHERMTSNIMSAVAQGESEVTGERTIACIKGAFEKGNYPIKAQPFGYDKKEKKLYINEVEASHVKQIFEYYSVYKLSTEAIAMIMHVKNSKLIKKRIVTILRDRRYTGVIHYRGTDYFNIVPKMIEENLFDYVQEMLSAKRRRKKYQYHFSSKLFCIDCNRILSSVAAIPKEKAYLYYRCENDQCSNFHQAVRDDSILEELKEEILSLYNKKDTNKQVFLSKGSNEYKSIEKEKVSELYLIPKHELLALIVHELPCYNIDLKKKKIVSKRKYSKGALSKTSL